MNITDLNPRPLNKEPFERSAQKFLPESPGCYVLATFAATILYIGLTRNLRRRFGEHLDNPKKRAPTASGRATIVWWIVTDKCESTERAWLLQHEALEGRMPTLNRVSSPLVGV